MGVLPAPVVRIIGNMMMATATQTTKKSKPAKAPPAPGHAEQFASAWAGTTSRFISSVWCALTVPCSSAAVLSELRCFSDEWIKQHRFGRDCFATPEQFNLYTCIWHAHDGNHRPTIIDVVRVMNERGWCDADVGIGGGCLTAELDASLNCEVTAAGLMNYAAHMVDYRDRAKLARDIRACYREALSPFATVESIVAELAAAQTKWRDEA